jgi:predicted dehydrogenase
VSDQLGVAIVGVGRDQWSGVAHIPALAATPGVNLVRLVTGSPESAANAEADFGVPASAVLDDALADPSVDVVTVTVRVARHAEIAIAAIEAGKHVYCEWPLAIDTGQADTLRERSARYPDRIHVVGLQGRYAPAIRAAADAVQGGEIGRPLRATVDVLVPQALVPRPRHRAHLRHRTAGAGVLSIQGGHVLDIVESILGRPGEVRFASVWNAIDEFVVLETGERLPRDAPDNVIAVLDIAGVPTTVQLSHTAAAPVTLIRILGTTGEVTIKAPDQPQMSAPVATLTGLDGSRELGGSNGIPVPGWGAENAGYNVGLVYGALAEAAAGGDADLPLFSRAVELHRLIDAIERAAS